MIKRLSAFLDRVPLFRRAPDAGWTAGRKAGYWLWNILWLLAAGVGIALCSMLLAPGPYALRIALGYLEDPRLLVLNTVPVVLLLFLLYFAIGRGWIAFLATAVVVLGFSIGNYFKITFRDDPLLFEDLLYLKEAGNMAGNYAVGLDLELLICLVAVLAGTVFLSMFVRWKPRKELRIACPLAAVLVAALLANTYLDESIYNATFRYDRLENRWSSTQQYLAHGFVYPFLHSITDALPNPPEGYNAAEAEALLAEYSDADIPETQKVNVVGIMLEAFNDFSKYDQLEFATDVYGPWRELSAESYTGWLTTNIFAGGTIDTERTFLTGYSELDNYRRNTNSYVWYFKEQGYQTMGDHPCYEWFYNRLNVNGYLGFDSYRFVEDFYGAFTGGGVAYDEIFLPQLLDSCLTAMEEDAPLFSFSVSYQGHGPYDTDVCWWGETGSFVVDQGYSSETQNILDNYFGSVADTVQRLSDFVDSLRDCGEPVVLVVFGDHNPWMGDGNSVYQALGISFDMSTEEGFHNYYDTPYLIWANDMAKEALGNDFVGEGPTISPCFLMTELFDLCGWEGPALMQAAREVREQVPVVSITGRYEENGALTDTLSAEGAALVENYAFMQYYLSRNFRYGDLTG